MIAATTKCACGCKRIVEPVAVLRGRPRRYAKNACRKRADRKRQKLRRSLSPDWYTPADVFAEGLALSCVDAFDLDPCAAPRSPVWSLVPTRFTIDDDGLHRPWHGRVWLNPPYGKPLHEWIAKAIAEVQSGRVCVMCMLVPASTDTGWWHDAVDAGFEPSLRRGRISFVEPRPDGSVAVAGPARFASAFLTFRLADAGTKGRGA